jgi:hypothetical protein
MAEQNVRRPTHPVCPRIRLWPIRTHLTRKASTEAHARATLKNVSGPATLLTLMTLMVGHAFVGSPAHHCIALTL